MIFWWNGTSYIKLIERDSPLSLSVWSSPSWLSGYHHGKAGGLINGGPSIIGMWPPTGGLVPEAGPTGREGPSLVWWDSPPIRGAGIIPGRGGPGRLGGGGIPAPAGGGAEDGVGGLSLLKCCGGFVRQALSLSFHPFLIVVLHILFGFPTPAVCLSLRWRVMVRYVWQVWAIKLGHVAAQAVGHSVPCRWKWPSFSIFKKLSLNVSCAFVSFSSH